MQPIGKRWWLNVLVLVATLAPYVSCLAGDDPAATVRRTEDLIYGRKFGMALTLDLFQPAKPNGSAIVFLVNGGWLSSKDTPLMVTIRPDDYQPFLERGYTVFAVVTSSQPRFTILEQVADVHRAVRFIRSNAERFAIQADRIGISGSSSGGQLALMIAAQGGPGVADALDPVDRQSSLVQAVAVFFPPTDFLNYGGPTIDAVGLGPMEPLKVAFGPGAETEAGRPELGRAISPIYHVTSSLPPTVLIHGDADKVVPLQQAVSFAERAEAVGGSPVRVIVRAGKGHGWGDFWRSQEDLQVFADWFDTHLRK